MKLVDLAGSEQFDKAGGDAGINSGLLALDKVLMALSEGKPHVPYRDTTLTRLLQSVLAGNCRTMMLICISPAKSQASAARCQSHLKVTGHLIQVTCPCACPCVCPCTCKAPSRSSDRA